jgi:hypothetical protein
MTIKAREFGLIVQKLGLHTRRSGDLLAWFVYEGKECSLLRDRLRRELLGANPDKPLVLNARAWAAGGTVS